MQIVQEIKSVGVGSGRRAFSSTSPKAGVRQSERGPMMRGRRGRVEVWCGGREGGRGDVQGDGPCVRSRVRATSDPVPLAYSGGGVTRADEGKAIRRARAGGREP